MNYEKKLLFTPGPLTTSKRVKEAMLHDLGTRDEQFNMLVQDIRKELLLLANANPHEYTALLLQGSGTYGVESVLTSSITKDDKVLILENGAYGKRMLTICQKADIAYRFVSYSMLKALPIDEIESYIMDASITHVACIHCETTAGVLNDIERILEIIHRHKKISIIDAMSSFASIPINLDELQVDFLITSSNKCLHGVPGIAIVFAKKTTLMHCKGICKSLSLDLYDQYMFMEEQHGGFRFTAPTHVLLALHEAIKELQDKGGIVTRYQHYKALHHMIKETMVALGFEVLVDEKDQSPIITTYLISDGLDFKHFYDTLKDKGFLLYSGKLPNYSAFRIGNIGNLTQEDIEALLICIRNYIKEYKHDRK